ncbi:uncharacterized protein LOC143527621 [Brachyhypopomus gauderio]|uniref:uncharacterized protein LOC143527621 n=1 Tax=Brachyhypopomus gauderio TaxID=698409 RepID=UPI0040416A77
MRKLSALLFVLLLCSLQLVSSAPDHNIPADGCCRGLSQMKLPIKRIMSYSRTDSSCAIKAVMFKMDSGKQLCMDPASDWVDAYMREVDQSETTSSGESPESTQLQSGVTTAQQREIPDCCPTVTDEKKVESSSWTSSSFTPKVTVFETVAGKQFCVESRCCVGQRPCHRGVNCAVRAIDYQVIVYANPEYLCSLDLERQTLSELMQGYGVCGSPLRAAQSLYERAPHVNTADCCSDVSNVKIPLKKVVSYKLTHSDCATKAIVFKTVAGKQFCVSPDAVWVSSHVTTVDTRNSTTVKTTTTTHTVLSE